MQAVGHAWPGRGGGHGEGCRRASGTFIAEPALLLLAILPVAIALLPLLNSHGFPRNDVKKLKFASGGPHNSEIRAPERRPA